ncbi:LolA family protein [Saccharicrinis aurantiacus]|uniref:LolA family protein n=1 Tax=Saccharicrinis aurantiacus TaxID=1849719 RepID=UPI002491CA7F|nr:outer membrane lipoprotein carrier protein LolA [Saccharicrinis aurantiacus]
MKKLLFILAILPTLVMAQDAEKAKGILDKVTNKTKTYTTIQADFSFGMENKQEEISEEYDGIIFIKGEKYKASLMDVDSYFDGKTLWTHMIDAEEVNVDEPDPEDEETLNPATIFTIYQSGFKFAYKGEETIDGVTVEVIDLYPENRDKPYSRIKLKVIKESNDIYSIEQVGKDGNNYTITIKNMNTNNTMEDAMFVFDTNANPDVDVIDMR